jgi:CheY-like chemotaxis protein
MSAPGAPFILIAEDYPDFRARLLSLLEPLTLACAAVSNGREAIDVLRDVSRRVDLLVTDMDMPVHTGWDVIEAVRSHRGPELPIIMQTGEAKYTYFRRKADNSGIVLIDKTEINERLEARVRAALGLPIGRQP